MARTYKHFWIKAQGAKLLPRVGSGFRKVEAAVGRKWVFVRGPHGRERLRLNEWRGIPKVPAQQGQTLGDILAGLTTEATK